MRKSSSSFGNFVADTIRVGLAADVAIINAGFFRSDEELPGGRILRRDLEEAFIYDQADSIVAVQVTRGELGLFYEHALSRAGSGGFLQVSHPLAAIAGPDCRMLRLALPKFLLEDDQDGYRAILLAARGWTGDHLSAALAAAEHASLIDLVQANTGQVQLDFAVRLAVKEELSETENWVQRFMGLARIFARLASRKFGIDEPWASMWDPLDFLRDPDESAAWLRERLDASDCAKLVAGRTWLELGNARTQMRAMVKDVFAHPNFTDRFKELLHRLRSGRETHEHGVNYGAYLNAVINSVY